VGLLGVLTTLPTLNTLYRALPLNHMLWPVRFLGIASTFLLLGVLWYIRDTDWHGRRRLIPIAIATLLLAETLLGRRLVVVHPQHAYQGATTARTVAALNEAMRRGKVSYLVSRLDAYGVDDVVLLKSLPVAQEIAQALVARGFVLLYDGEELALYHRDGVPRALAIEWQALGIGRGAQNAAFLFPSIVVGTSIYLDEYTLNDLTRYPVLILSGFQWHDKARAEALPHFLDVWGEPVVLDERPVQVTTASRQTMTLAPFGTHDGEKPILWYTHTPQGLSGDVVTTSYIGEKATLVGYKEIDGGRIWFVGYNLFFYVLSRHEPQAIRLLETATGLTANALPTVRSVPFSEYAAGTFGYRFTYRLETPQTLLVPVAAHDRWTITLDEAPTSYDSFERLLVIDAPAGTHRVTLQFQPPFIYTLGRLVSLAAGGFLVMLLWHVRRAPARCWPAGLSCWTATWVNGQDIPTSTTPRATLMKKKTIFADFISIPILMKRCSTSC